jgi:hypothetical protein
MSNTEDKPPSCLEVFQESNAATSKAVLNSKGPDSKNKIKPLAYGTGIAVQSISQSVAIAVQDASDLMRDIATIESTAIGVATKKMIAEKNPLYIPIIESCQKTMSEASKYWLEVGENGAKVLGAYQAVLDKSGGE